MGGQQDILVRNISKLSPEVQQEVYSALRSGNYGQILTKAREQGGDYQQARVYMDRFFNTAEGRRFGAQEIYITPYSQRFEQPGRVNVYGGQPEQSYITPSGKGMSISKEELQKGLAAGSIPSGGIYRDISGGKFEVASTKPTFDFKQHTADYAATQTTEKPSLFSRGVTWTTGKIRSGVKVADKYTPSFTQGLRTIWKEADSPMTFKDIHKSYIVGKTDFQAIKSSPRVGFEMTKSVFFSPFKGIAGETKKVGIDLEPKHPWIGGAVVVTSEFIPTSPRQAAGFYGGVKAFKYIPKITKTAFTTTGSYGLYKAETPKDYLSSGLMVGIGTGGAILKTYGAGRTLLSPTKPYKIPSVNIKGTPLRRRATIIVKDTKGKYLVHVDKSTKAYMTFGGKIEKGETPFKAARRELFEESGLKPKLKYKETFYGTKEKHYVYEAIVERKGLKLKPQASEVSGFKWIKPPRYTGATALQPYGRAATRFGFDRRIIKSEDLTILSKSKYPGITPTKLVSDIPESAFIRGGEATFLKKRVKGFELTKPSTYWDRITGRKAGQFKKFQKSPGIEYGFESRYDIPYSKLKPYEGKKLTYIHGSAAEIQTQLGFIAEGKMPKTFKQVSVEQKYKVEEKYFKRGEKFLFFQPPTTADPLTSRGYVGLTYLGLYKAPRESYGMGVKFGRKTPTIQEFKGELGKDLSVTQKAYRGKEFEAGAKPGSEFYIGDTSKTWLSGRKVKIVEITKGKPTTKQTKQLSKSLKEGAEQEYYLKVGKRPVRYSEVISHSSSRFLYSPKKYRSYRYASYKYTGTYKLTTYKPTPTYDPYKTTYKYRTPTAPPTPPPPTTDTPYYPTTRKGFGIPPTFRVSSKRGKTTLTPQLKPQPKKYVPSLRSKALGITATKIPKSYVRGASGVSMRPIIIVKRKRKKKNGEYEKRRENYLY